MSKPHIGFMGLGLMGGAMVECLQSKGYAVTVLGNRNRAGIEAALTRGATEATDAKSLTEAVDIVMLCMGTSEHVEGRVYGEAGVLAGLKAGQVVIDFGTSLPSSTQKIAADMAAKGGAYLDGPLGRTPAHAKDGLLNIMCAGDEAAFARVKPVLEDLGENVFHLGASGAGHTVKLMNNFFGMTIANAMAEAFAVADLAGVDRDTLHSVMSAGPLNSPMMGFVHAYATRGEQALEFSIANAAKDVGYYRQMAADLGAESVMSACAFKALTEARDAGMGEAMVAEMVDRFAATLGGKS